ncbi:hypothetical protein [Anatilimnocola floriformis]|uniref:hypothetical protein n=1 Tax=Anatilimnocola floriformis TaxID=2948575 RepID=UPI0020C4EA23|nr:hypothetical protein [Anatilimnocola floriformis]
MNKVANSMISSRAHLAEPAPASYSVLLLPQYELVARGLSLREATAWARTYNEVIHGDPAQAVLAEEFPQRSCAEAA